MELQLVREEIPKITRPGGSGREAEPWEKHLESNGFKETPGVSYRVWTYDKRTSAVSRMTSVRERLTKAVPHENWKLAVRLVPNTTPEQFGVYIAFEGLFTDEQVVANAKAHKERSERVRKARAKTEPTTTPETSDAPAPTAKERVATAHKAKAS